MYRTGKLAKMVKVAPDTIRYCEKQQMTEHEVCTEDEFYLYTESDLRRLKFIRHTRQLDFSPESIRELLSIRINLKRHTCQESRDIAQERLQGIEARITEPQSIQRSLQHLNNTCYGTAHSSVYRLILEALERGASDVRSSRWFFALAGLRSRRQITNWGFYEPISVY